METKSEKLRVESKSVKFKNKPNKLGTATLLMAGSSP
jgi:hypothetical protein